MQTQQATPTSAISLPKSKSEVFQLLDQCKNTLIPVLLSDQDIRELVQNENTLSYDNSCMIHNLLGVVMNQAHLIHEAHEKDKPRNLTDALFQMMDIVRILTDKANDLLEAPETSERVIGLAKAAIAERGGLS